MIKKHAMAKSVRRGGPATCAVSVQMEFLLEAGEVESNNL
jgi:hypothetical protein